jgi:hypothetical protein
MVHIIAGEKGKGKTKILINQANEKITQTGGTIIYLDKNNKHMYELNTKIRLINVKDYFIDNNNEFIGFICGLLSQDHDLDSIFIDSFLKVSHVEMDELESLISKLNSISNQFQVDFILSISLATDSLPESMREDILIAL